MHSLVDFHSFTREAMIARETFKAQITIARNGIAGQLMFLSSNHYRHYNKLELRLPFYDLESQCCDFA